MNRATRLGTVFVLVGLLTAGTVSAGVGGYRLLSPGDPVPALALDDLDGNRLRLEPGQDRAVLLYFWSVYCPNCKEAMPGLVSLTQEWQPKGLRVWAVNVDGARFSNAVVAYAREMDLPFPVVFDRLEGEYLVAADPLGVTKTPTAYLVGPDGRVAARQVVRLDFGALAAVLEKTLGP